MQSLAKQLADSLPCGRQQEELLAHQQGLTDVQWTLVRLHENATEMFYEVYDPKPVEGGTGGDEEGDVDEVGVDDVAGYEGGDGSGEEEYSGDFFVEGAEVEVSAGSESLGDGDSDDGGSDNGTDGDGSL